MVSGLTLVTAYMLMGDTPVSNPDPVAHVNLLGGVSRLFTVSQDVPLRTPLLMFENVGELMMVRGTLQRLHRGRSRMAEIFATD